MTNIFKKETIIFTVLLVALIMIGEFVFELNHLPSWPAFMIMIFFFMSHTNIKEVPAILVGSFFGMANLILIKYWYYFAVPLLGGDMAKYTAPETVETMFISKLIYVAVFVAAIIFLKDVLPILFNNYAFMLFTVAAIASNGNTAASLAAKTVAGAAASVVATGGNAAELAAVKVATDKAIAATVPITSVYQWMAVELIGGACFILGIYAINKLLAKLAGAPAQAHSDIKG